ncbi:ubiquitin-protein ligase (E3) [Dipsacomyces acuminosporus]|nr:ubiquitin-protein ligase (E3) [Dipsacomyces acuminosporus]
MFGFHGDYKRQRNINLGGNRRNDPKRSNAQALLNKAHEERQRRELERRRQKAASYIQSYWRGIRDTSAWRQTMRTNLDVDVLNLCPIVPEDVYHVIARFIAYYNGGSADTHRFHAILEWLFSNGNSDSDSSPTHYHQIISMLDKQHEGLWPGKPEWATLISRLLASGLRHLVAADKVSPADTGVLLRSLRTAFVADDSSVHPSPGKAQIAMETMVLKNMIETKDLYGVLAKIITDTDRKTHSESIALAASLAALPFESAATRDVAQQFFARSIMAVPGLPSRIGIRGVTSFTKSHIPWEHLARHVQSIMDQKRAVATHDYLQSGLSAVNSMGNIAAFILPQLSRQNPSLSSLAAAFIESSAACARMIPSCDLFGAKGSNKKRNTSSLVADRGAQLAGMVDTHSLKWLNNMLSLQVLELLVQACSNETGASTNKTSRDAQELLLVFIQQWGETASSAVLDNLLQVVDIRAIGWRKVLSDPGLLSCFTGDSVKAKTAMSFDLVGFQLLCEVLNRQLQTIGDDELFRQGMSLPVDDIVVVAKACRNIAFALHWEQTAVGNSVHIRDMATALTRQLYIRDARHPFVEEGFWLVPPSLLDMSSFADRVAEDPLFTSNNGSGDGGGGSGTNDDNEARDDSEASLSSSDSESESEEDMASAGVESRNSRASWLMSTYSGLARTRSQRRELSVMAPRIAVLRHIPFVVPFNDRVRLFHALVNKDRNRLGLGALGDAAASTPFGAHPAVRATVRRGKIFDDGFRELFPTLSGKPVQLPSSHMDDGSGEHESATSSNAGPHEMPIPHVRFPRPLDAPGDDMELDGDRQGMSDPFFWGLPPMPGSMPSMHGPFGSGGMFASTGANSRSSRSDMFKRRMQIEFVDRYGMVEAGIDGGGVFKEFLTSLVREAFDPKTALFNATAQNSLYPNPGSVSGDAADRQLTLDKYEFLGAVIGKALYEGVLVDAPFALFFLSRWLSQLPGFNDLPTLDEDLYRGLVVLKNYPVPEALIAEGDEEDAIYSVFGLDFTITTSTADGQTRSVPLVPKGDAIKVTSHNRLLYLDLVAQHKLVKQIDAPVKAFLSGLHAVIPPVWLRLLFASPLELSRLLCGDSGAINTKDWKRNTVYAGAFSGRGSEHPTIKIFWDVVESGLTEKQRRQLCKFATSCERPPLLGFSELNPRFCIRSSDDGDESLLTDKREQNARLPSASTCVNLLKLPIYSSKQVLREKLVTAIESGAGFDLS